MKTFFSITLSLAALAWWAGFPTAATRGEATSPNVDGLFKPDWPSLKTHQDSKCAGIDFSAPPRREAVLARGVIVASQTHLAVSAAKGSIDLARISHQLLMSSDRSPSPFT